MFKNKSLECASDGASLESEATFFFFFSFFSKEEGEK